MREIHRQCAARVYGSHADLRRAPASKDRAGIRRLFQPLTTASGHRTGDCTGYLFNPDASALIITVKISQLVGRFCCRQRIMSKSQHRYAHFGVTRSPHEIWATQQFKEATAGGRGPRWIIRDNDCKYGSAFDIVAEASGTEVIRTPFRSPLASSVCERFIGSARRECLDHMLIFGERQLQRIVQAFVDYFNRSRPHQGIGQGIPCGSPAQGTGKIIGVPVLNGLHHEYRRGRRKVASTGQHLQVGGLTWVFGTQKPLGFTSTSGISVPFCREHPLEPTLRAPSMCEPPPHKSCVLGVQSRILQLWPFARRTTHQIHWLASQLQFAR